MNDESPPDAEARTRLSALTGDRRAPARPEAAWADGKAGRLVERWLPGGTRGVEGVRALTGKHRFGTVVVLLVVVLVAVVTATVLSSRQPAVESAPVLPPALSAGPAVATTSTPPTTLVVSVVGKVTHPGLVTLSNGARVADAIEAAGGLVPGTDDTALNLARRVADGEQIYVGVPVPPGVAATDDPTAASAAASVPSGKGTKKGGDPNVKVNLNTATAEQLETLPGVGPATATRILTWRGQHGHFDSISQLRDVGGIGQARYSKMENLVTT